MINMDEAIKIAEKWAPNLIIKNVNENPNYYIVDMVPEGHKTNDPFFLDGAIAINKRTRKVEVYNPLINGD